MINVLNIINCKIRKELNDNKLELRPQCGHNYERMRSQSSDEKEL